MIAPLLSSSGRSSGYDISFHMDTRSTGVKSPTCWAKARSSFRNVLPHDTKTVLALRRFAWVTLLKRLFLKEEVA